MPPTGYRRQTTTTPRQTPHLRYPAKVPARRPSSLRIVLPLLALALSATILAVPLTLAYIHLRQVSQHGGPVSFHTQDFQFTIPRDHFFSDSLSGAALLTSHFIQALNLPAFSIELLVDRCTSAWPMTWTPTGMDFMTWRALIFPVYCLPFWYLVGFGFDASSTPTASANPITAPLCDILSSP